MSFHVIASDLSAEARRAKAEAKQSSFPARGCKAGLLRRFAPRNDGAKRLRNLDLLARRRPDDLDAARADQMRELDHRAVGARLRQADAVLAADHLDGGKVRPRRV